VGINFERFVAVLQHFRPQPQLQRGSSDVQIARKAQLVYRGPGFVVRLLGAEGNNKGGADLSLHSTRFLAIRANTE